MKIFTLLAISAFFVLSCSDSISKPNFKFMKAPKEGLAAKFGNVEITHAELDQGIETEIFEQEKKIYEIRYDKLKALVIEKIIESDPNKKGLTTDQYLEKYIASNVKVSSKDIDKFITEKNIPKEHINPQIKERVKAFLLAEKKKNAVEDWLGKKTKSNPVEVYISKPRRPSFKIDLGDAPIKGGSSAKVTIVEYSDFQCPFCAKGTEIIEQIKKKYGKKVKIAFKNFPLPFHNQAKTAAVAGLCAQEQSNDKFWKMHDKMFADQTKLDPKSLKETAKALGLDQKKFDTCLDSNKYLERVEAEMEAGRKIGVKSTPTFFVNGKLISGAQPIEVFSEVIDEELSL
jgi:protein-disulfide isomerase